MLKHLSFKPLPGLSSPHAQTIIASFTSSGPPPPSTPLLVPLSDGDIIYCHLSQPDSWQDTQKTIVLIHGLAGSANSNYMVRIGRKLYELGYRVIRMNLRGSGIGSSLAKFHYHGGSSEDVFEVLQYLKLQMPQSPLIVLGFSLGGNIALKLAGELGAKQTSLVEHTIAVCSPIDLENTARLLEKPMNMLYQRYYLDLMLKQTSRWTKGHKIGSLYEYDTLITAPLWGFSTATEYYRYSSSRYHLHNIAHPCYLLLASDDPFVDYKQLTQLSLPSCVQVALCQNGGHMGFLGWTDTKHRYFWLDNHLIDWIGSI